uniref:50S ribosomal protein l21 n=1 Tax=Cucumis melo subsp. melo TaxID=412675 RepID=E5GCJ5_CUCME|nr:50S ribosomal protein l21 [Cucumis melo subsp. melo]
MASLTLSLCANFSLQCRLSTNHSLPLSTPFPSSSSNHHFPLSTSSSSLKLSSSRSAFSFLLNSSDSETAVIDSDPDASQALEIPSQQTPNREEIFAVVMIGSRQYIVFPGRYIHTQRLKGANVNDKVALTYCAQQ